MVVQHADNTATSTPVDVTPKRDAHSKDVPDNDTREESPSLRSSTKKRKRDETGSPSARVLAESASDSTAPAPPPKKKVHTPVLKASEVTDSAINEIGATNGKSQPTKDLISSNGDAELPNGDAQPEAEDNEAHVGTPHEDRDDEENADQPVPTAAEDEEPYTGDVVREDDDGLCPCSYLPGFIC